MALPAYLGRYAVLDEIARGGFATVVRARDEELNAFVAVKILHAGLAEDPALEARFLEEARLMRRIRSAHVVTVHDIGRMADGRPYFVMDFADRGTLADRLAEAPAGPPHPRDLMAVVDALADGLAALHDAGVVHRDVKPANVLLQATRRAPRTAGPTLASAGAWNADTCTAELAAAAPGALVRPDERVLVGDLGIAKDLAAHGPLATLIAGTPLYRAPEQMTDDPAAEVTPAADVYAATALVWAVLAGGRPPGADAVAARLGELPDAWHRFVACGMAADPAARYPSIEAWRAAAYDSAGLRTALPAGTAAGPAPAEACPYKGLAAYQPEDADSFFGREALIDDLLRRLQHQRVLVVGGPSGSGKSSLVRAGLIPELAAGALPGSETWRVVLMTPGRDPLAELHVRLAQASAAAGLAAPPVSIDDLAARPALARVLAEPGGGLAPLLLCIDQFEELFTLAPKGQRDGFVAALSAAADPADSRVRLVLAVRADFYAACAQVPWLAERITDNQVLVGPMTGAELRRAITEPAVRAGLHVERPLVDAIVDEAGHEAGSLPLIAHALVETWARRQGRTLTLDGYRAAGGVAGAIGQTADALYEIGFGPAERDATRRLFLRLVTPGEGTPDTRRLLARTEIERDGDPAMSRRVVDRLTEARLLTVDDATIQIAHEALLRTWPRLRAWIEECRDDLRMRQRIAHAAHEWDAAGRDPDLLYRGTPLLTALEWMQRNPDQPGALDRDFLDAGRDARAAAEAQADERRRRARRGRRAALAVLSVLAAGASAASVVAFVALGEARRHAERAEQATAIATERFAGALGAVATGLVETDPVLALSLAAEAMARSGPAAPGYDARSAMLAARAALATGDPYPIGAPMPAGDALSLALAPDGARLATAQRDGTVRLFDVAARQPTGEDRRRHSGGVQGLDFSPDGRRLASVGDDGTVRVSAVDGPAETDPRTVGTTPDILWGVRFDPTGRRLATAGEDGTVRLWDAEHGGAAGPPLIRRVGDFLSVAFGPAGDVLLAGNGDGEVHGWTLPSGKPLFAPIRHAHTSDVWHLAVSGDGSRAATASSDGTSRVLALPDGRVLGTAFGPEDGIGAVAFGPDGRSLIGGAADGAVRLWDVEAGTQRAAGPPGHGRPITDLGLSADGRLLATLGADQLVRLWRLETPHPLARSWSIPGTRARGLAIAPDGGAVAAGDDAGTVRLWKTDGAAPPRDLAGHGGGVWALAFSRDGTRLATGDRAGTVRLWDLAAGAEVWRSAPGAGAVWWLGFAGDRLVSAAETAVSVHDGRTGAVERTMTRVGGRITRAALSPDDGRLAVTASDGRVTVFDVAAGSVLHAIAAEDDVVWSAAFSRDGRRLATASSDEVVGLWDSVTGQRLATLTGHAGGATDLAFLADGATLAVLDRRGGLHWWDTATGRRLVEPWPGHDGAGWRLAAHPDGARVATVGDDGRVLLWDALDPAAACAIAAPFFDADQRTQYLGENEPSIACPQALPATP